MPTYGYRCENGHEFEVYQAMSEAPLTKCQECGQPVRRIFYPVGIVFKGPGFYKTDSRGSSSSTTPAPAIGASGVGSDSSSDKSESSPKTEKKPDAKMDKKSETKPASGSTSRKSA
ncbi:MAG TPA: FmdB family zinc ribbon protein [Candidatus Dormibacteraeota bacterium]|nr:FmdB family zinc ribbon protein [Candidatus Dormibacteraeota bacterium]